MSADEVRDAVQSLLKTLTFKQVIIDKLTHENATLESPAGLEPIKKPHLKKEMRLLNHSTSRA